MMSGTLEQCLGKLHELYVEGRMSKETTTVYLLSLRHPNGNLVYNKNDVDKMLDILDADREAHEERLGFEAEELEGEG